MSPTASSTSSTDRRRAVVLAAALAAALAASGCGFRPIHADRSPASAAALRSFEIALIADRPGQLLREELLRRFRPADDGAGKRFSLGVRLSESISELGVRKDDVATRSSMTLTARFEVRGLTDGRILHRGSARAVSNYDILSSAFATLSARDSARLRNLRLLADDITERVSVWLLRTDGAGASRSPS